MRGSVRVVPVLVLLGLLTTPGAGQVGGGGDFSGAWSVRMTAFLPEDGLNPLQNNVCLFEGSANVVQAANAVNGSSSLMLISGPGGCPQEMMATLTGTRDGNDFSGMLDGGQLFGTASIQGSVEAGGMAMSGTLSFDQGAAPQQVSTIVSGSLTIPPGQPFTGVSGTWSAAQQDHFVGIPALSGIGLALMVALLLGSALLLMRRAAV